jgi:hypothetical protein
MMALSLLEKANWMYERGLHDLSIYFMPPTEIIDLYESQSGEYWRERAHFLD